MSADEFAFLAVGFGAGWLSLILVLAFDNWRLRR